MAKSNQRKVAGRPGAQATVSGSIPAQLQQQGIFQPIQAQQQTTQIYQGPVPHPDQLEGFERIVPGAAQRLIQLAEEESRHRRTLELQATEANIASQHKQLEIADYQSKAVFRSDTIGQIAGVLVSLSCLAGSVFLAVEGHEYVAVALAAIPTAAVIQAFFAKRQNQSQPQQK